MELEEDKSGELNFRWTFEGFTDSAVRNCSSRYAFRGSKWHMLYYPKLCSRKSIKLYVEGDVSKTLPMGSTTEIFCAISILNQKGGLSLTKPASWCERHRVTHVYVSEFERDELEEGYLVNDTLILEAQVIVINPQEKEIENVSDVSGLEDFQKAKSPLLEDLSIKSRSEDETSAKLHIRWTFEGFTNSAADKNSSKIYIFRGSKWYMLYYRKHGTSGSIKLHVEGEKSETLPIGSSSEIVCSITILNQKGGAPLTKPASWCKYHRLTHLYVSEFQLDELTQGYLVNDTLILEAEVRIIPPQEKEIEIVSNVSGMEDFQKAKSPPLEDLRIKRRSEKMEMVEEMSTGLNFRWTIKGFSSAGVRNCSDRYTFGGSKWQMLYYPKHNRSGFIKLYVEGDVSETLPIGSSAEIVCTITILNQKGGTPLAKTGSWCKHHQVTHVYVSEFQKQDLGEGYLVDDTLILEANVRLITPQDKDPVSYLSDLKDFIGNSSMADGQTWFVKDVSLEEVEKAKESLRKCFSEFSLLAKLFAALVTLSSAKTGLSPDQKSSVETLLSDFDSFARELHISEEDRLKFLAERLGAERSFSALKRSHERHLECWRLMGELGEHEDVKPKKEKLVSEWKALVTESEKVRSDYNAQAKRLKEAEERMKKASEQMGRVTAAWSGLKDQFSLD